MNEIQSKKYRKSFVIGWFRVLSRIFFATNILVCFLSSQLVSPCNARFIVSCTYLFNVSKILPILLFFQTNYIYEWFHAVILCYWLNIYGGFLNINVFMLFYETNSFSNLKIFQIYSTIKFWNWIIILFPS